MTTSPSSWSWQKTKADSPKSWTVDIADIDPTTLDLSVMNPDQRPSGRPPTPRRSILEEMASA